MKEENVSPVWIAPLIKRELDPVKQRVLKKDRDFVCVIDGEEGVGKSVLAQQLASYCDPNFNINNIVFTADDFMKVIKDPATKKGSAIVLDEAFSASSSRASLSEVNKAMIGVATEMRQKNLFVFMVLPTFFDLDKYFAVWRCRTLFHLYFDKDDNRRYIVFPKEHKKTLYLSGKKMYNYSKPKSPYPPFAFPNKYMVDETEYRKKKADAFKKRKVSLRAQGWLNQRNSYIRFCLTHMKQLGLENYQQIADVPRRYGFESVNNDSVCVIARELSEEMDIKQ